MNWLRVLPVVALLGLPFAAAAQEADILTGKVTGTDNRPLVGVRVEAMSIETEITRSVLTDGNGRYMIVFPDGGGRYLLRFSFLGLQDALRTVMREAGEELLVTNLTLNPAPIQLDAISVQANRPPPTQGQTGEQTTDLSLELLSRLPLPDMDPATMALLAAGVLGTSADSLSGRMGFSVAGMSDLLNQITLDGMILGEGGIQAPELGLRTTQITTSTFDVSRGGFAGGQVSMSSARGNNRSAAGLLYRLEDDALQMSTTPTSNPTTNQTIGGSIGGPILRNRLFYNASFEVTRNVTHRFGLSPTDPLGAQRSGVATDSIARFLDILDVAYGFPTSGQTGRYNQYQDRLSPQFRMDWNIAQGHTLTASFNGTLNDQDSTRISTVDLFNHGGESSSDSWRGSVSMFSRLPGVLTNLTNTLRLSFNESWSDAFPYIQMPEGRVNVTSDFEDGTRQSNTLVFGGNRSLPTESYRKDFQLSNDVGFLMNVGDQIHRLKVGGSVRRQRSVSRSTDNLFGSFSFNSLEDFENNLPASFTRSLAERETRSGSYSAGLYVGDTWRPSTPLEITLGLRWDHSQFDQKPAYNPAVEQAFGRRTDFDPQATRFSPRLGFNLRLNQQGQPAKALTGGIGLSASDPPGSIFSAAARQTGLPDAEQSLRCIGDAVPIPDWDLFSTGELSVIPTSCADGGMGSPIFSSRAPTVTLINPDQRMPSSLRAEMGYRTQLPLRFQGNFRYVYSRGIGLWGYSDLNLAESRTFVLGGENRVFFGDPTAIVARTGNVSMVPSRLHPEFGNVYDVTSALTSSTHQFVSQISGVLPGNVRGSLNYTLTFARDQGGSGSFSSATTGGNPNVPEWSVSGNDRRHTFNLNVSYPFTDWFEVTARGRVSSGAPFTPMVRGDINGDGVSNDRAFIFDPGATTDTAVSNAMNRLLDAVPDRIRSCLEDQLGTIAARNSCRNGWSQSLDMRVSVRPPLPTLGRRLTVAADLVNVLSGLDQLFHGKDIHGWGESPSVDRQLLDPQAFDPTTNRFIYEVNEGFGQNRRGAGAFRSVFAIRIQANIAVGGQQSNRGFQAPLAFGGFGGGGGRGGGGGFGGDGGGGRGGGLGNLGALGNFFRGTTTEATLDSLVSRALVNPLPEIVALKDTLGLSVEQITIVRTISDTLEAQLANRRNTLRERAQTMLAAGLIPQNTQTNGNSNANNAGNGAGRQGGQGGRGGDGGGRGGPPVNPELAQQIQLEIQPQLDMGRIETTQALRQVEQTLTAEQWQKVPARIRNSGQQGGGRGGPGGGRGGFNAVGMLDRMLANPIPVLLELKDTLKMTPEQVTQIEAISAQVNEKLTKRRETLGKRFDNVQPGEQQGRVFQEIQPEIEAGRKEVTEALKQIEKILSGDQWKQVPERIKNPFQNQAGGGRGGRGGRGGGEF